MYAHTDRYTDRHAHIDTHRLRHTHRHTDTDRQTVRQTDRHTKKKSKVCSCHFHGHTYTVTLPVHNAGTQSVWANPPGDGTSALQEGCPCLMDDSLGTCSPTWTLTIK